MINPDKEKPGNMEEMRALQEKFLSEQHPYSTNVWAETFLWSLGEIDARSGTFEAGVEVRVFWLLSPRDTESFKEAVENKATATWKPTWEPTLFPVNVREVQRSEKEIFPDGSVYVVHLSDRGLVCWYALLTQAIFQETMELQNFPFDVQDLQMDFHFHEPWHLEKGKRDDSINGLDIKRCKFKLNENCFMSTEFQMRKAQVGRGHWHNMLRLNVKVARRTSYYIYRVQVILALITCSALAVNFVQDSVDGQLGYLSACLLAAVAYLYVVGEALPKLQFLTSLDKYVYASIIFIILLIIQCGTVKEKFSPSDLMKFDAAIFIIIQLCFLIDACCRTQRRTQALSVFPVARYKAGLVTIVQYSDRKQSLAEIAEATKAEYEHMDHKQEFFEADVPPDWAK